MLCLELWSGRQGHMGMSFIEATKNNYFTSMDIKFYMTGERKDEMGLEREGRNRDWNHTAGSWWLPWLTGPRDTGTVICHIEDLVIFLAVLWSLPFIQTFSHACHSPENLGELFQCVCKSRAMLCVAWLGWCGETTTSCESPTASSVRIRRKSRNANGPSSFLDVSFIHQVNVEKIFLNTEIKIISLTGYVTVASFLRCLIIVSFQKKKTQLRETVINPCQ